MPRIKCLQGEEECEELAKAVLTCFRATKTRVIWDEERESVYTMATSYEAATDNGKLGRIEPSCRELRRIDGKFAANVVKFDL
jgi:hypothetical protein